MRTRIIKSIINLNLLSGFITLNSNDGILLTIIEVIKSKNVNGIFTNPFL